MPMGKLLFLWALVIGAAGLSLWLIFMAIRAEALDAGIWRAVVPLMLLAGLGLRGLRRGAGK